MNEQLEREEEESKQCRFCLDDADDDKWISPCKCRGSQKYVHKRCLDAWRRTSINPRALTHCTVCHTAYKTRNVGGRNISLCAELFREIGKQLLSGFVLIVLGGFLGQTSTALQDVAAVYRDNLLLTYSATTSAVLYHLLLGLALLAVGVAVCSIALMAYHLALECAGRRRNRGPMRPAFRARQTLMRAFTEAVCRECVRNTLFGAATRPHLSSTGAVSGKSNGPKDCCGALLAALAILGIILIIVTLIYSVVAIIDKRNQAVRTNYIQNYEIIDFDGDD